MIVTRIVLSLAVILVYTVGLFYIKLAYMQIGPIGLDLYVRPPKKMAARTTNPNSLCHLLKLSYGMVESSIQSLKASD